MVIISLHPIYEKMAKEMKQDDDDDDWWWYDDDIKNLNLLPENLLGFSFQFLN